MTPLQPSPDVWPMIDPRLLRQMIATTVAGVLVFLSVALAGAGTLVPAADTGGGGADGVSVADMLRGEYSPVEASSEIAVIEVEAPETAADVLRGDYSPIDAALEIAVTDGQSAESVAGMLRGDYSPVQ